MLSSTAHSCLGSQNLAHPLPETPSTGYSTLHFRSNVFVPKSRPDLVPETWFTNLIPRAQFVQPWWFLETELLWNLPGTGFRNLLPQNLRWEVPLQLLWGKPILDFEHLGALCSAFHLFVFDMRTTCTVPVRRIQPCVALMFFNNVVMATGPVQFLPILATRIFLAFF